MKPIYIMALHGVRTGGPEAIHQLSDALISQGFDARIVYYDWPEIAKLEQVSPQDGYRFPARTNEIEEYAHYKTNVACEIPNAEEVVVVLPETLCHLAPKFDKATVLIWWLSVDNGFAALDKESRNAATGFSALSQTNLNRLRVQNVRHAAQSNYAIDVLNALQLPVVGLLTDYTVDLTSLATPAAERPKLVLFNANYKVTTDLQKLADEMGAIDPQIQCIPLRGLSKKEIAGLFSRARLYVDLGCFPGKDRAPREAASLGCYAILAECGAAFTDSFGVGTVVERLEDITAERLVYLVSCNPGEVNDELRLSERSMFFREVRKVFSGL